MAKLSININSNNSFVVTQTSTTSTVCSSIFKYNVKAIAGDSITITLTGLQENSEYTLDGVTTPFTNTVTLTYGTTLAFEFSLQNSGDPGVFDECAISVANATTLEAYNLFEGTVFRDNDGPKCDSGKLKYDELLDTPDSKVGQAGKYIKVSDDEQSHEYVDSVPGDATYVHTQATASTSWVIPHMLGKFPSVRVKDGAGNNVYGNITDVDSSNMTITFNTAFSGVAYLN